jgi:Ran GTPase-activating protein (RanGAP) involved in mRNA processing and transport
MCAEFWDIDDLVMVVEDWVELLEWTWHVDPPTPNVLKLVQRLTVNAAAMEDVVASGVRSLRHLTLSESSRPDRGVTAIRNVSSVLRSVHTLKGTSRTGWQCTAMEECVRHTPQLTSLDLASNLLCSAGALALASQLSTIPRLRSLNLETNNLQEDGACFLASHLSSTPHLTSLNLANNWIQERGAISLVTHLSATPSLTSLDMGFCGIGSRGASELALHLSSTPLLTTLHLETNDTGSEGVISLATHLSSTPSLTSLSLAWNEVGDAGARALALHLSCTPRLAYLDLENNAITREEGASSLIAAKEHHANASLLRLLLFDPEDEE